MKNHPPDMDNNDPPSSSFGNPKKSTNPMTNPKAKWIKKVFTKSVPRYKPLNLDQIITVAIIKNNEAIAAPREKERKDNRRKRGPFKNISFQKPALKKFKRKNGITEIYRVNPIDHRLLADPGRSVPTKFEYAFQKDSKGFGTFTIKCEP